MQIEVLEGRGQLHVGNPLHSSHVEVDFRIKFLSELRTVRSNMPPVVRHQAEVDYIRPTDRNVRLEEGDYFLSVRSGEIHKLRNHGFKWMLLAI